MRLKIFESCFTPNAFAHWFTFHSLQTSGLNLTTSDGPPGSENNNIENFNNSSKRLRLDGEAGSPLTPPSFKENNNKESLLSQALAEKPAMLNFMTNNGGGRSDGHDDSGASDTGSERPESMMDGSMKTESSMPAFDLHRYRFFYSFSTYILIRFALFMIKFDRCA